MAKELNIAIGLSLPPYVFPDTDTGMELDVVQIIFEKLGYSVTPVYVPYARVLTHLKSNKVQGAMTINESSGVKDVFYTDSHITYQNVAVSLTSNNFEINNIKELDQYTVLAFQNATKYLGNDFLDMSNNNPLYKETAKQQSQVPMLYLKRYQLVVLDINIFKYYKKHNKDYDFSSPITYHQLFPKTDYKLALTNKDLRDKFNIELLKLKESGQYNEIMSFYVN